MFAELCAIPSMSTSSIKTDVLRSAPSCATLAGGPVWQLHGSTAKDATCFIEPVRQTWALRLVRNSEILLNESYPDRLTALEAAERVKDHLLRKGWTQVPIDQDHLVVAGLLSSLEPFRDD